MIMSWVRIKPVAVAAVLLLIGGCKKDDVALTADWNHNVDEVQKYSAKFAAFKPALDARLAEATKTFEESKTASGEEKSKKLQEASSRLKDVFAPFDAYEAAVKGLKAESEKASKLPPSLAKLGQMARVVEEKTMLAVRDAKPTNIGEGKAILEEATTLLKDATGAFAAADGYAKADAELTALLTDKEVLNLPAGTVMPLLDAAKQAQATSARTVSIANPTTPSDVKLKITQATEGLVKAMEPIKKLKPAPKAAPAAATKPGTPPAGTKPGTPPPAKPGPAKK